MKGTFVEVFAYFYRKKIVSKGGQCIVAWEETGAVITILGVTPLPGKGGIGSPGFEQNFDNRQIRSRIKSTPLDGCSTVVYFPIR